MNYLIGIIKILISLCLFVLGLGLIFVIMDSFDLDYPDYAKYLNSLAFIIVINDALYILVGGINKMKKKDLTRNNYTLISLVLVYFSIIAIIAITISFYTKNLYLHKTEILPVAGLELALLFVAIYDSVTMRTNNVLPNSLDGSISIN